MAKTHGRTRLPLPESLTAGLAALGFVPFDDPLAAKQTAHRYRIVRHPKFILDVASSNMPGDAAVIAAWTGQHAKRLEIDPLLAILRAQVERMNHPNQRIDS